MKKFIFLFALLAAFMAPLQAQRVSLTETAKTVEQLEQENQTIQANVATLEERLKALQSGVDTLSSNKPVKIPTTVAEAEDLLVYVMSFVMFIVVGFIGDKLPKWLTPFIFSVITGAIIAVIAYFGSSGEFTVAEAFTFFLGIAGGGNLLHQIKKPKKTA